ncbi:hypothetical protein [Natronolimnobius baerhuensis]|uniref:hypothetical protein n=1 Tax=Natronolimnobius baerhuensis TaxID=253108 RepID=UPI001FEAEE6F|nr:hypothetical protein [Natronolimnobius baerhuensis]
MPIYRNLQGTSTAGGGDVDAFLPDSDGELCDTLEEMQLPATVDEITDELITPAQPPLDTWAGVHERLHQDRLPALAEAGEIEFDETQGVVERSMTQMDEEGTTLSAAVFGTISLVLLFALLTLVSVSLLTALTVTVVTTTVVWFVPSFV